jgi:hypothetical protein
MKLSGFCFWMYAALVFSSRLIFWALDVPCADAYKENTVFTVQDWFVVLGCFLLSYRGNAKKKNHTSALTIKSKMIF